MSDATPLPPVEHQVIKVGRETKDLTGEKSLFEILRKAVSKDGMQPADTNQGVSAGQREHLINKDVARRMRDFNPVHAACLDAKESATVGLGHRDEEIHTILNPLCDFSWQDVLDALSQDFWEGGECFLECVVSETDEFEIQGLHHVDAARCHVEVEEDDKANDFHYVVEGETGTGETTVMARFGDMARLKKRYNVSSAQNANDAARRSALRGSIVNSVIIHIRQATNRSRYYGLPDYMSATPAIELVQCMNQHEFDFYFNRGVPEFLLFLIGRSITPKAWSDITSMIQASQGLGNSHKTGAVHLAGTPEDTHIQIERLGIEESGNQGFSEKSMTHDLRIATAHGVPPILANILLPGKIGAANEGPNALHLIQKRKIGKAQRNFSSMLALTLAGEGVTLAQPDGSKKSLKPEQFLGGSSKPKPNPMDPQGALGSTDENGMPIFSQPGNGFKTILDGMTLGAQDTLARMKEPLAGSSRNPEDGLLGSGSDRKAGDPKRRPGG